MTCWLLLIPPFPPLRSFFATFLRNFNFSPFPVYSAHLANNVASPLRPPNSSFAPEISSFTWPVSNVAPVPAGFNRATSTASVRMVGSCAEPTSISTWRKTAPPSIQRLPQSKRRAVSHRGRSQAAPVSSMTRAALEATRTANEEVRTLPATWVRRNSIPQVAPGDN